MLEIFHRILNGFLSWNSRAAPGANDPLRILACLFCAVLLRLHIETENRHIKRSSQVIQLRRQKPYVPGSELPGFIVGQLERLELLFRELIRHHTGHFFHAQLQGRSIAGVPGGNMPFRVYHDRHAEAKLPDGLFHRRHGGIVSPWVIRVWNQVIH